MDGLMVKVMLTPFRVILLCASMTALTGCGVIYTVPTVSERSSNSPGYGTDYNVEIVPLTYETAAGANLKPYIPPRLPLAFQPDAAEALIAGTAMASGHSSIFAPLGGRTSARDPDFERLPPPGGPSQYRVGVGDVLLLAVSGSTTSVAGLPGLISAQAKRTGYTVQDDGAIAVPDAGRIKVAGMTLPEAERNIFQALAAAGIDPSFTLEVAEFRSQHVSVVGAVGAPQLIPIALRPLLLEEALAIAGGVSAPVDSPTWIEIHRRGDVYQIPYERYLTDAELGQIRLQDRDRVYIATSFSDVEEERKRKEEAEQLLAKDRDLFEARLKYGAIEQPYVFVARGVGRTMQVSLPFERKLSLANILFSKDGGGLDATVDDFSQIYVLRRETDPQTVGGMTAYHLDAANVANLAVAVEFEVHANDIVFTRAQPVTNWNRVISQLTPTPAFLTSTSAQIGQLAP